ncbi:MAG TPA: AraC family transcriptional regulator [Methylocystis sp.]|jgi:AraC-like DNA-binding protein
MTLSFDVSPHENGAAACRASTDVFSKGDEVEGWTHLSHLGGYKMRYEVGKGRQLRANAAGCVLPGVSLVSVTTTPHVAVWRDGWMESDDIAVYFNHGGGLAFKQNGREETIADTGAVIIDLDSAGALTTFGGSFTVLRAPRRILGTLANDGQIFNRTLRSDTSAMRLLESCLGALAGRAHMTTPRQREMIANHVQDLLALAIIGSGDETRAEVARDGAAARLYALKACVDRHLFEPDLGADFLAKANGITPRHVRRLFETEGVPLSKYILERRMLEAYRLLTRPEGNGRTIVDIAFSVGFGDLSYFNRGFAQRFSATPREVRNAFGTSRKRH